jgi:hypothetical protein
MAAHITEIKNRIRNQSTEMILECITMIGGGNVATEERMVRACLLDIYQEREGEEAIDALLETLGM